MIKGLSRRIVMLRFPEAGEFEQAIFVLRDETPAGVSADQLVSEARSIAEGYANSPKRSKRLPPLFYIGFGAGGMGLIWFSAWLLETIF